MTHLAMTKLVVGDLERAKAFYEAVCGVREARRIDAGPAGARITELIMEADSPGGGTLVLFRYHDQPAPAPGEVILVFETEDVDAFVDRAVKAGGSVQQPPVALPNLGLTYAFVLDPEGRVLEPLCRKV